MSGLSVFTYSPYDVKVIISGHVVVAWNKCVVEYTEPTATVIKGIRGKHTRIKNGSSSAIITLTLEQTSLTNSVLEEIEMKDRQYGTGRLSVAIIDSIGGSRFQSNSGFVTRPATLTYDSDATDREWVIETLDASVTGGTGTMGGVVGSVFSGVY